MKKIMNVLLLVFFSVTVFSQTKDWHHLDLKTDSIFGVSTRKAYSELLKNKKPAPVIVAVIDSGVDTTHEDLNTVLWVNTKEKNNGIDDDKNGYTDDKFGWSFIEGIKYDNLELTRLVRKMRSEGDTNSPLFVQLNNEYLKKYNRALSTYNAYKGFAEALKAISDSLQTAQPTLEQLQNFKPGSPLQERVLKSVITQIKTGSNFATFKKEQIDKGTEHFNEQLQYHLNLQFIAPASMGSSNVIGADADHGTHVAGIIGADRMNNKGIEGIAAVRIMAIRAVPNGDERDEDVAKAIRYAADNGAKIINMSFGKPYSPGKQLVDDAVKYAMQKDILMVHGAGNDNFNLDSVASFPTRKYLSGNEALAWIEVGASGPKNDGKLKAGFSNYGNAVDVFAPGVNIYSSTPGSQYAPHDGTSMAAPVVAGIAALIRGYYPKLTAVQVKDIIMRSVIKVEQLAGKCKTGGVVNAYEAVKLAATYK